MRSDFTTGFAKTAGIISTPLKAAGRLVVKAGGGPLNTALTLLGGAADFSKANQKMQAAAAR